MPLSLDISNKYKLNNAIYDGEKQEGKLIQLLWLNQNNIAIPPFMVS